MDATPPTIGPIVTANRTQATSRRWRWLGVSDRELYDLLGRACNKWIRLRLVGAEPGAYLPPDAVLLDLAYSWERRCFMVRVEHPSFDEVGQGAETPFGGMVFVSVDEHPETEMMAREIGDLQAIIHDLREQLAGRGP